MNYAAIEKITRKYSIRQKHLFELRVAGYSQAKVARIANVPELTVSKYFRATEDSDIVETTIQDIFLEIEKLESSNPEDTDLI